MKHNIRTGAAVLLAGGLLAAYAGSAGAEPGPTPSNYKTVQFKDQDQTMRKLTSAVQMTKEYELPTRSFTGPTYMEVSPDDPRIVAAATMDLRAKTCHLVFSKDAGRTWKFAKEPPTEQSFPWCQNTTASVPATELAWGRDGTLYYTHQAYGDGESTGGQGHGSILLARTKNFGSSWQYTFVTKNRGTTENPPPHDSAVTGLSVDTSGPRDVVYVGFTRSFPDAPTDSPLRFPHPMVSVSTDGGATFGTPVDLNTFQRPTLQAAGKTYPAYMTTSFGSPFVFAHDGIVLAVAGSTFPFNDLPAPPAEAGSGLTPGSWFAYPQPQMVARSTDQGKTWTIQFLGEPEFAGTGMYTGLGWSSKGGDKGTFVAVYNSTPQTAPSMSIQDIVMQRSTDGGVTWSAPLAIDDDPPELNSTSFYPQLNVAPNGRIDVAWQDNREPTATDFRFDVRYTYSNDGGLTWAKNVKVNDLPNNFNYGISFNSDLRYPNGVASADEYAIVGWADTRNATDLTQTQDNYAVSVQFEPLPTTKNTTVPVIAAIFGGLVVAGIVLLLVGQMRKRKAGAGASASTSKVTVST